MCPPRVHVIGRKNSGKTTLIAELVRLLSDQGLRVATIKHTHHAHELDVPGKDSHRHRTAGAAAVAIVARNMIATFRPRREEPTDAVYRALQSQFADCDVILVEGDVRARAARIEVWRPASGEPPLAAQGVPVDLLVTDEPPAVDVPVLPRSDPAAVVSWIRRRLVRTDGVEGEPASEG
ncbi:MAG: molybdopterin-guanine dinucleotide biosynthesis protein B [Planctomycetota bacterium]|nr:MAG: molybdopterin-guanine dinucleotide biosynthesis protein B [Planctomycetota bacterium]